MKASSTTDATGLDLYGAAAILQEHEGAACEMAVVEHDGQVAQRLKGTFHVTVGPEPTGDENALWLVVQNHEKRSQLLLFVCESKLIGVAMAGDRMVVQGQEWSVRLEPVTVGAGGPR